MFIWIALISLLITNAMWYICICYMKKDFKRLLKINEKYKREFQVLNYFLKYEYWEESLASSLLKMQVNSIAIYGLGEIGNRIVEKLEDSKIEVKYGIDNGKGADWCRNRKIFSLKESLPQVDAILISVFDKEDEIKKELQEKTNMRIMSLEEIVCWT